MVDDFQPPAYLPVGVFVELPVSIRAYNRGSGGAAWGLTIDRPSSQGVEF